MLPHLGQEAKRLGHRLRWALQHPGCTQRVVPTDADDEMTGPARQPLELRDDISGHMAIDRNETCLPSCRQRTSELDDDVGVPAHVGGVVKDGVAEQCDMGHGEILFGSSPGARIGAKQGRESENGVPGQRPCTERSGLLPLVIVIPYGATSSGNPS
ncbi:hypothetical protein GCM10007886_30210 [Methylobacterium gregans]|nr:hypothetical protein GCM10007886_30210 [Methylobacterium gregans]